MAGNCIWTSLVSDAICYDWMKMLQMEQRSCSAEKKNFMTISSNLIRGLTPFVNVTFIDLMAAANRRRVQLLLLFYYSISLLLRSNWERGFASGRSAASDDFQNKINRNRVNDFSTRPLDGNVTNHCLSRRLRRAAWLPTDQSLDVFINCHVGRLISTLLTGQKGNMPIK